MSVKPPLAWIAPPNLPVLSKNVQLDISNVTSSSEVIAEVLCPTPLMKLIFCNITLLLNEKSLESPKPFIVIFLPAAPTIVIVESFSTTIPEVARAISEFNDSLNV